MDFYLGPCHSFRVLNGSNLMKCVAPQEGLFTTVFGLVSIFIIPAEPRDIRYLTKAERDAYTRALAEDWSGDADADGKAEEVFSWSEVISVFTNAPHVMLLGLPLFFSGVTVGTILFCIMCY